MIQPTPSVIKRTFALLTSISSSNTVLKGQKIVSRLQSCTICDLATQNVKKFDTVALPEYACVFTVEKKKKFVCAVFCKFSNTGQVFHLSCWENILLMHTEHFMSYLPLYFLSIALKLLSMSSYFS